MATPGYNGQVVGRDCNCEDFPCCGHGITESDLHEQYEAGAYYDIDDADNALDSEYDNCSVCVLEMGKSSFHFRSDDVLVCWKHCDCGAESADQKCGNGHI